MQPYVGQLVRNDVYLVGEPPTLPHILMKSSIRPSGDGVPDTTNETHGHCAA